jgi:fructose-specific phosphotransferase system IIC component
MNIRTLLLNMVAVFLITFIIAALVTFLWNLLRHDLSAVDWDTAFVLAITLGIVLPVADRVNKKST